MHTDQMLRQPQTALEAGLIRARAPRRALPAWLLGALLGVLLGAQLATPTLAWASVSVGWSAPVRIDALGIPSAISCPSRELCVAVDRSGYALTSTDPGAPAPSWRAAQIDPGLALAAVSCPSAGLCVAVDQAGNALTSTNPSSGPASWTRTQIDETSLSERHPLTGVSCPAVSLCVAVDQAGNVLTSTNPAASTWAISAPGADSGSQLRAVSCATATSCVAVDNAGRVLASSQPTGPQGAWPARAVDPALTLQAIFCTTSACLAADASGNAIASADPTSATPTWSVTGIDPTAALTSVWCLSWGVCLAVDGAGESFASEDPAAPAPAWSSSRAEPSFEQVALTGLSCTPDGLCVAVDARGRALSASVAKPLPPPSPSEPPPPLVHPHPTISGVPAVGSRLACDPGTPAGVPATLAFAWQRDSSLIAGATSSNYRVVRADATHHLQCWVTATNAAGSVTAHSAYVTVPAGGVLAAAGETVVGLARVHGGHVQVPIACSPHAAGVCVISMRLTGLGASFSRTRHAQATLGVAKARLGAGERRSVTLALTASARHLLAHRRRIAAQLVVTGTVIGVLRATLARQRLVLGARASSAHAASWPASGAGGQEHAVVGRAMTAARAAVPTVLTPTPYMGWDTYFALGPRYSESTVLAQASMLVSSGLARDGYRYVWLDVGWWQGRRDAHGQIAVDRSQWPHGLAWLTETLHMAGLRAGLYTDAGSDGCGGAHQGSYGHYLQDANTFAAWGFDAVKVDFCGGVRRHLDPRQAYVSFHAALQANSSRRPMLLSICNFLEPGQFAGDPPFGQSAFASYTFGPSLGGSWRTDTDVGSPGHVTFDTVLRNLDADAAHPEAAGPGHWNDPDYLGPDQGMTASQFQAQLSMWAILAAPLMVSDDLQSISPASLGALRNNSAIAIDQDPAGIQGTLLSTEGEGQVWSKPLAGGDRAVALLNRGASPLFIQTSASAIGMRSAPRYLIRNVWAGSASFTPGAIGLTVPGESAALMRVALPTSRRALPHRPSRPRG